MLLYELFFAWARKTSCKFQNIYTFRLVDFTEDIAEDLAALLDKEGFEEEDKADKYVKVKKTVAKDGEQVKPAAAKKAATTRTVIKVSKPAAAQKETATAVARVQKVVERAVAVANGCKNSGGKHGAKSGGKGGKKSREAEAVDTRDTEKYAKEDGGESEGAAKIGKGGRNSKGGNCDGDGNGGNTAGGGNNGKKAAGGNGAKAAEVASGGRADSAKQKKVGGKAADTEQQTSESLLAAALHSAATPLPPGVQDVKFLALAAATSCRKKEEAKTQKQPARGGKADNGCNVVYFSTPTWDRVKHTTASRKSYLQYYDHDDQKWHCLYSSTNVEHKRYAEFIADQLLAPQIHIEHIKDLAKLLRTGEIKLMEDWRERGIVFGGESADSRRSDVSDLDAEDESD